VSLNANSVDDSYVNRGELYFIPAGHKVEYLAVVKKYMAQEALLKSYAARINKMRKELASLTYQKQERCAQIFMAGPSKQELVDDMNQRNADAY
jgi:hypothetical protein